MDKKETMDKKENMGKKEYMDKKEGMAMGKKSEGFREGNSCKNK